MTMVCNRMQAGERFEVFLANLGFTSNEISVCRNKEVGVGIRVAFSGWLNRGKPITEFVDTLYLMREFVLLRNLGLGDVLPVATTRLSLADTPTRTPMTSTAETAIVGTIQAQKKTRTIGFFVDHATCCDAMMLWCILNDNNLELLMHVLNRLGVLSTQQVAEKLVEQQRLWQNRHNLDATSSEILANPTLYFFSVLCRDKTFASQPFADFARATLVPLGDERLSSFVGTFLSCIEGKKSDAQKKNEAAFESHTVLSQWLVERNVCTQDEAPAIVTALSAHGFSSPEQLALCDKSDIKDLGCFTMRQTVTLCRAMQAPYTN